MDRLGGGHDPSVAGVGESWTCHLLALGYILQEGGDMPKAPNKSGDPRTESPRASTSAAEEAPAGEQNPEVACPDTTGQFCTNPNPPPALCGFLQPLTAQQGIQKILSASK